MTTAPPEPRAGHPYGSLTPIVPRTARRGPDRFLATLRSRLIVSIAGVVLITIAVALATVYGQTGAELRAQIDRSVRAEAAAEAQALTPDRHAGARAVLGLARHYTASQPYTSASVILFAIIPGVGTASNHPELLTGSSADDGESVADQHRENALARRLSTPRRGLSTQTGPDVGRLRIDQVRVRLADGTLLYAGAAESLAPVRRAEHGVLTSFALAGAVALGLGLLFAYLLGTRMTAPLAAVSRVAARIDAGDLAPRLQVPTRANRELVVLAEAFNRMLDRLADAFDAQREFVADASHELRTPLTVIRGQIELLAGAESVSAQELRRVEHMIGAEITRLTRLTDDLLLLARSERDDFLRRRPVTLAPFIHDLWDGLSLTAERHFEVGELPAVTLDADPDRLAQALRNLAANAVRHTEPPDGLVRISASEASGQLRITVADDGPGIPRPQRTRVFERFYRTDRGRARAEGGAGLGLAIVAAIVSAHGGSIHVEDAPGGGAAFVIVLPITPLPRP